MRLGFTKTQQKEDGGEGKQRRRRRGGGEEREEETAKEAGQDRDPEWGTWGSRQTRNKTKTRQGKRWQGRVHDKRRQGRELGRLKRVRVWVNTREGEMKGGQRALRGSTRTYANKNENISPTFVLEEK